MKLNYDIDELETVAKAILNSVNHKIIVFYGEMGVGKTTLISEMVKILGGKNVVSSPTFSIVNEYDITDDKVYHFDFYRIKDVYEALDIGIEDYFNSNHWIFIEWPDKIEDFLPLQTEYSYITTDEKGQRTLELTNKKEKIKI